MVSDLKNPALCARLMTGHQKLLNSLVLKLQLKTESRLCYLRKLEAIKSKIHVFRKFKIIPKSTTRENWSARNLKLRNIILCHVTEQKIILKVAESRGRDDDDFR